MKPDLTVLGKIIGGGLPVGAFGGRAAIMDQLSPDGPVYQAGTLSGNPIAMAAGLAQLREFERLDGWKCAVEFRNGSWLNEKNAERTTRFLVERNIPFVMVDEPQGFKSSVPPEVLVTSSDLALVRFHGRNAETWEKKGITPAERFRYLYSRDELSEWIPRIREVAKEAREVHLMFNNCYANYGTTNAREIVDLLNDLG